MCGVRRDCINISEVSCHCKKYHRNLPWQGRLRRDSRLKRSCHNSSCIQSRLKRSRLIVRLLGRAAGRASLLGTVAQSRVLGSPRHLLATTAAQGPTACDRQNLQRRTHLGLTFLATALWFAGSGKGPKGCGPGYYTLWRQCGRRPRCFRLFLAPSKVRLRRRTKSSAVGSPIPNAEYVMPTQPRPRKPVLRPGRIIRTIVPLVLG